MKIIKISAAVLALSATVLGIPALADQFNPGAVKIASAARSAPDFRGIQHWLNSGPLSMAQLRGKVVLVDFWTFGCINCQRTLPYWNEWAKKYANKIGRAHV